MPEDAGPIGGAGLPLTPWRSIAVDRNLWAYGLPVWLETTLPKNDGPGEAFAKLTIAEDTGSAILGPARADLYHGSGPRRAGARRAPPSDALRRALAAGHAAMRRRKELSPEELALWAHVAASVQPLPGRRAPQAGTLEPPPQKEVKLDGFAIGGALPQPRPPASSRWCRWSGGCAAA